MGLGEMALASGSPAASRRMERMRVRIVHFIETAVAVTAALAAWLVAACTRHPDYFCCTSEASCAEFSGQPVTICTDPARPYCDDAGEYGARHACIPDPASASCSASAECPAPLVCDAEDTRTCVECTAQEGAACAGATPVCGDDHVCRGCRGHAECSSSGVCLTDGRCAAIGEVAYVQAGETGSPPCAKDTPCGTLQAGITAVNAGRPYIKVAPGTLADVASTIIDGKAVTIFADPGARLDRTGDGRILVVRSDNANVLIYDLEFSGQSGLADEAIYVESNGGVPMLTLVRVKVTGNQGRGISTSGGMLTVLQSTISGNAGGGAAVMNGMFEIVGNMFINNGNDTMNVGGVAINTTQSAENRLEFNSFNLNKAFSGKGAAIDCFAGMFTARNNIMFENGTLSNMEQVGGSCVHAYSIVRPGLVPSGTGNTSADPLFVNSPRGDLHVRPGSPARAAADPSSNLTGPAERDIDGDVRIAPADIGADEVP